MIVRRRLSAEVKTENVRTHNCSMQWPWPANRSPMYSVGSDTSQKHHVSIFIKGDNPFVILFDQAEVNCLSVLEVNFGLSLTIHYAILVRILAITDFLWLISIWFCSYTISWGLRFILTWFYLGEYQANQCSPGQQSCEPCTSRKPSCVGLDDGNQPFPGRLWQQQFIVCNKNRTTSVSRCPGTSVFNPNTKQCVEIQNITKCE